MTSGRLVRFVAWAGWASCLCTMALSLASPDLARSALVQWSPWLFGLFSLGIPHGALDHRVGSEIVGGDCSGQVSAAGPGFYAAYLTAAVMVLALWFAWPAAALKGFLAVAAIHFGQGDVYWSHRFGLAARSGSKGYRAVLLLTRSLLPIALPLLAFPGELCGPVDLVAARFFGRSGFRIEPRAIEAGLSVLAAIVGLQVSWACWEARRGDLATRRAAALDILETSLLVALFATVPPILALGVYFNAWHSSRHLARLLLTNSTRGLVESGHSFAALAKLYKNALPMTCGALLLMAVVFCVVGRFQVSVIGLGMLAMVGLSMLTLPHVIVVTLMDARQGVWSSSSERR